MPTSRDVLAVLFATGFAASGALFAQDAASIHRSVSPDTVSHRRVPPKHAPHPADRRDCLRDTGSLIPPKPGHCLPVFGRSYSAKDLRDTGATSPAEALQRLDPAIGPGR